MKKLLLGITVLATAIVFTGCSTENTTTSSETTDVQESTEETQSTQSDDKINIVTTSFHEYDWLTQVIGDEGETFNVSLLIDNGVDLHSYEPTVEDIATITSADLFIYNGGESDSWAEDIIAANPSLNAISVMDLLEDNVQSEVLVDGMEEHDHDHDDEATEEEHDHEDEATEEEHDHDDEATEEEHDHDDEATEEEHDHDDEATEEEHDHEDEATEEEHDHEDEAAEDDEHVWLSLNNAIIVCELFAEELSVLDTDNADTYSANAQVYNKQLQTLSDAYDDMIANAERDTIIVTDRFPFLYLASDYNINYYAAFSGCSTETEASFETIVFLAEKANEYDVNYLLIIDNGLESLASTVAESSASSDLETLVLDSMQSVTQEDIDAGATYYSIMESNLEVLRLALAE